MAVTRVSCRHAFSASIFFAEKASAGVATIVMKIVMTIVMTIVGNIATASVIKSVITFFTAIALNFLLAMSAAHAQQEYRYTETAGGGNEFVLGYPPPVPVDSAVPIDGFRSYNALHARHQDLMLQSERVGGTVVGRTLQGRDIWAYALGDEDAETVNAGPESSLLVNGGLHAREWGTPELTTALIETVVERAGDAHLYDYLADNVHFVVVPVSNIDGFLQTQRYPTRVLVGSDPRVPNAWPRDGRMRRKNMRDADTALSTRGDHLFGVDLNRNSEPFWAIGGASSSNRNDLVYHGSFSFSEPETRALMAAAEFAREDRLRWYEDVHSFTQVLFSVSTFNARRNAIQSDLLSTFDRFHNSLSLQRHGVGRRYPEDPNRVGSGIGVTAEYFGYQYQIPAWTLEIEPRRGAVDYGGLGTEHDGFILPESEVARLREDMALTHAVLAYRQAGPPSVVAVEVKSASGRVVRSVRWVHAGNDRRVLESVEREPLLPGFEYTMSVAFDKPMRWDDAGEPGIAPGHDEVPFATGIVFRAGNGQATDIDLSAGRWMGRPGANEVFERYRYDTFRTTFVAPVDPGVLETGSLVVEIDARDFTGQRLDADPETVVDWSNGGWRGYENTNGLGGDSGGIDSTLALRIVEPWEARLWLLRRGNR